MTNSITLSAIILVLVALITANLFVSSFGIKLFACAYAIMALVSIAILSFDEIKSTLSKASDKIKNAVEATNENLEKNPLAFALIITLTSFFCIACLSVHLNGTCGYFLSKFNIEIFTLALVAANIFATIILVKLYIAAIYLFKSMSVKVYRLITQNPLPFALTVTCATFLSITYLAVHLNGTTGYFLSKFF